MQTIQIENELYNKLIKCGIDIQFELQKLVDDFKAFKLSEEEIKKLLKTLNVLRDMNLLLKR